MASIQKRQFKNNVIAYRVLWRDETGRQLQSGGFDTKKAAEVYKAQVEAEVSRGIFNDPTKARTSFGTYAEQWYGLRQQTLDVSASRAKERSMLNSRILPRWDKVPLPQISNQAVREWIVSLNDDLAPASVRTVYVIFTQIMKQAAIDGYLPAGSPVGKNLVPLPKDTKHIKFLSQDQLTDLLALAKEMFPAHYALIHLAANTGMRQGELFGLVRSDYSSLGAFIQINRSRKRVPGSATYLGLPKTGNVRRIDIDPGTKKHLDDHLVAVDEMDFDRDYEHFIFPAPHGDAMIPTNWNRRVWHPLRVAAGHPDLHFHDLRHTHATLLFEFGNDAHTIAQRLGHSSTRMTIDVYGHARPGAQAAMMKNYPQMGAI